MKRTLYFGPHEALGLSRVLAAFQSTDRTQKRIVTDLFTYFQLTDERKAEISFEILPPAKKREMGFGPNDNVSGWNQSFGPKCWSQELTGAEWEVLTQAMDRFDKWEISDRWETGISDQLAAKEETTVGAQSIPAGGTPFPMVNHSAEMKVPN